MSDARRDRRQNRRFAAGGSGHDRRDPRDIEIERLNQRIRELELIQQPFEDLYQRDDEDDRTVTDSVVWDDLAGTCDVNYDSPPLYDVYEDEEWYSWTLGGEEGGGGEDEIDDNDLEKSDMEIYREEVDIIDEDNEIEEKENDQEIDGQSQTENVVDHDEDGSTEHTS